MDKLKCANSKRPFLLLSEDLNGNVSYCLWNDEKSMQTDMLERIGYKEKIILAIEILAYRNIETPFCYSTNDFIEKIKNIYNNDNKQNSANSSIKISTDRKETYYINKLKNGFKYNGCDYLFEDIDSISGHIFIESLIGEPIEIKKI